MDESSTITTISKDEVYQIFKNNNTSTYMQVSQLMLASKFGIVVQYGDQSNGIELDNELTHIMRKLKYLVETIRSKKTMNYIKDTFLDITDYPFLSDVKNNESTLNDYPQSDGIRKHLSSLQRKQRQERLTDITERLETLANQEDLSFESLICLVAYNYCWANKRYKLARTFKNLYDKNESNIECELPIETAINIKERSLIGKRHYTNLRLSLKPYVEFPTYDAVSQYFNNIIPKLIKVGDGFRLPVALVSESTLSRLPQEVKQILYANIANRKDVSFIANFSAGVDGSGSHKVYNSSSYLTKKTDFTHYIAASIALQSISIDDETKTVIYTVDNCCSFNNQRPIALRPGKETKPNLEDIFGYYEFKESSYRQRKLTIDFGTFKAKFRLNIKLNQIDSKMIKT